MLVDPYSFSKAHIVSSELVAADTVAIRVSKPDGYRFIAGQYTVVRVTVSENSSRMRQYSFSSAPADTELELLIQREPGGEISTWFYDYAKPGMTLEVSRPFGAFSLETSISRPILAIAGKVGVAPFVSMLRSEPEGSFSLLYCVTKKEQVCFPRLMSGPNTTVFVTHSIRRIDAEILKSHLDASPLVYICGSKQFVDSVSSQLSVIGVDPTDIHRELFTLQ